MSFTFFILMVVVLLETAFAFLAVRGIRKRRIWMIIVFSVLFFVIPFVIFFLFSYGITMM